MSQIPKFGPEFLRIVRLDEGGWSDIYHAIWDRPNMEKTVVLKVLKPELRDNEECCKRFRNEGRVMKEFHHPNILPCLEVMQTEDGNDFLVLPYIAGTNLQKMTSLPEADLVPLAIDLCDSLAYMHGKKVFHRDIKPSNVLYDTDENRLWLLDFGISKLNGVLSSEEKTKVHHLFGTHKYRAPEVGEFWLKEKDEADFDESTWRCADIYSFGATLYAAITKEPPTYSERNRNQGLTNALRKKGISREFCRIIVKCLSIDRKKRYKSIEPIRAALWKLSAARAKAEANLNQVFSGLERAWLNGRPVVVLAGSGLSRDSGIPSSSEIHRYLDAVGQRRDAAKRLKKLGWPDRFELNAKLSDADQQRHSSKKDHSKSWLDKLWDLTGENAELRRRFLRRMIDGRRPSNAHRLIACLARRMNNWSVIWSTALDDLLREAFTDERLKPEVVEDFREELLPGPMGQVGRPVIVKLHGGVVGDPEPGLLTSRPNVGLVDKLLDSLFHDPSRAILLVLGYSGSDRRGRTLVSQFCKKFQGEDPCVYWLHRTPSPPAKMVEMLQNDDEIPPGTVHFQYYYDAEQFLHELYARLTSTHPMSRVPYHFLTHVPPHVLSRESSGSKKDEDQPKVQIYGRDSAAKGISSTAQGAPLVRHFSRHRLIWCDMEEILNVESLIATIHRVLVRNDPDVAPLVLFGTPSINEDYTINPDLINRIVETLRRERYLLVVDSLDALGSSHLTKHQDNESTSKLNNRELQKVLRFLEQLAKSQDRFGESRLVISDSEAIYQPLPEQGTPRRFTDVLIEDYAAQPLSSQSDSTLRFQWQYANLRAKECEQILQSKPSSDELVRAVWNAWRDEDGGGETTTRAIYVGSSDPSGPAPKLPGTRVFEGDGDMPGQEHDADAVDGYELGSAEDISTPEPLTGDALSAPFGCSPADLDRIVLAVSSAFRRPRSIVALRRLCAAVMRKWEASPCGDGKQFTGHFLEAIESTSKGGLDFNLSPDFRRPIDESLTRLTNFGLLVRQEGGFYWMNRVVRNTIYDELTKTNPVDTPSPALGDLHDLIAGYYFERAFQKSKDPSAFTEFLFHRLASIQFSRPKQLKHRLEDLGRALGRHRDHLLSTGHAEALTGWTAQIQNHFDRLREEQPQARELLERISRQLCDLEAEVLRQLGDLLGCVGVRLFQIETLRQQRTVYLSKDPEPEYLPSVTPRRKQGVLDLNRDEILSSLKGFNSSSLLTELNELVETVVANQAQFKEPHASNAYRLAHHVYDIAICAKSLRIKPKAVQQVFETLRRECNGLLEQSDLRESLRRRFRSISAGSAFRIADLATEQVSGWPPANHDDDKTQIRLALDMVQKGRATLEEYPGLEDPEDARVRCFLNTMGGRAAYLNDDFALAHELLDLAESAVLGWMKSGANRTSVGVCRLHRANSLMLNADYQLRTKTDQKSSDRPQGIDIELWHNARAKLEAARNSLVDAYEVLPSGRPNVWWWTWLCQLAAQWNHECFALCFDSNEEIHPLSQQPLRFDKLANGRAKHRYLSLDEPLTSALRAIHDGWACSRDDKRRREELQVLWWQLFICRVFQKLDLAEKFWGNSTKEFQESWPFAPTSTFSIADFLQGDWREENKRVGLENFADTQIEDSLRVVRTWDENQIIAWNDFAEERQRRYKNYEPNSHSLRDVLLTIEVKLLQDLKLITKPPTVKASRESKKPVQS